MRAVFNRLPEPGIYEVFEHPTGVAHIELSSGNIRTLAEKSELRLGGEFIQPPYGAKYVSTVWVILDVTQPDSVTPTKI